MAEDKMENGYELLLECYDNTKLGEIRQFLEVPIICIKRDKFFKI